MLEAKRTTAGLSTGEAGSFQRNRSYSVIMRQDLRHSVHGWRGLNLNTVLRKSFPEWSRQAITGSTWDFMTDTDKTERTVGSDGETPNSPEVSPRISKEPKGFNMKYLVIIQARCGSSRLPSKVLKVIEGKTALEQMLDRVRGSTKIDEIIVATTINPEDVQIVNIVSGLGYRVFVGSSGDVLDRYYQAAKLIKPEYVVRLTADCPLFDWRLLDEAIEELEVDSDDLCSYTETFPDGEDLEIIRFSALEDMWHKAHLASEREHVTLYVKNHPEIYKLQNYECKLGNLKGERWTLDEPEDLEVIRAVYRYFSPRTDFSMEEIYAFLKEHPKIHDLNQRYVRNEGLLKSLAEDRIVN